MHVQQPPGHEIRGYEDKVYKLKKTLYRLKKAPRAWYNIIDSYMMENGFKRNTSEPTLYTKINEQGQILIVYLNVDDLIFTGNLSIDMFKYAKDILKRFRLINHTPVSTPMVVGTKLNREDTEKSFDSNIFRKLVGSLMYLKITRPDIMYGVSLISRFMDSPKN